MSALVCPRDGASTGTVSQRRRRRRSSNALPLLALSLPFLPTLSAFVNSNGVGPAVARGGSAVRKYGGRRVYQMSADAPKSRTQRIMEGMPSEAQASGAGGSSTFKGLQGADRGWTALRNMKEGKEAGPAPTFVTESGSRLLQQPEYDVAVCGGTLGIFMATALQLRGFSVVVVERGPLRGREQEWNISEAELDEVVGEGVLTEEDKKAAINIRFNPLRAGFKRDEQDSDGMGTEVFCDDVLNMGVSPNTLVERARNNFVNAGGVVLENTSIDGICVHANGAALDIGSTASSDKSSDTSSSNSGPLTCRLVLDCMGNASPIVRQVRWGKKPDGVCLVVGSCARGFDADKNTSGDIIYANSPIQFGRAGGSDSSSSSSSDGKEASGEKEAREDRAGAGESSETTETGVQYFWEAFPAGSGPLDRTTYMFAYMDAAKERRSLSAMMEDYWDLLPIYQGKSIEDLQFLRVLFGFFPTYKASPLQTSFDRICQIGDASGMQSPLSFGGFACLTRHLPRLRAAMEEALRDDLLDKQSLRQINFYIPALSSTWMFQKSMSVGVGEKVNKNLIVDLLANNFASMERLGLSTLKPFLQDVVQFGPLLRILIGVMLDDPLSIPPLIKHVGIAPLLQWTGHFLSMGWYTLLHRIARKPVLAGIDRKSKRDQFKTRRMLDAWEFGSGLDYKGEGEGVEGSLGMGMEDKRVGKGLDIEGKEGKVNKEEEEEEEEDATGLLTAVGVGGGGKVGKQVEQLDDLDVM